MIEKERARSRSRRHIGHIEKSDASAYGKCTDNNQYCSDWARAGHCTLSDYVRENCKLSCRAPGCDLVCKDTYDDCEAWKNMGHCFVESVKQACPKSCNPACQGGNPPTQRPVTEKPKTDGPVRTDKPVTGGPQPTRGPNPTAIPRKTANGTILGIGKLCLDKKAKCKEWADRGDCSSNPRYMLFYCAKSCKSKTCDMEIPRPPGECANPLGLSWDGTSNFQIPHSLHQHIWPLVVVGRQVHRTLVSTSKTTTPTRGSDVGARTVTILLRTRGLHTYKWIWEV